MARSAIRVLMPLGTGPLMPAIVAGYEVGSAPSAVFPEPPDWLFSVEQQAGGYAMSYPTLVGAVMPLALNRDHAHATPEPLLDCFHAMAEDPDFAMLTKRFPTMRSLCGTRGKPYSSAELSRLGSFLASHFDLPPPTGGLEALVHLERGRGVADARGWTTVVAADGVAGVGEDFGLPSETWKSGSLFDGEHERILRQIGSDVLRSADPPSLFLIWENSD